MRTKLELEEAMKMIPNTDTIHVFRNPNGMLIGADWSREEVIDLIKQYGAELSGEQATRMGHGLAVNDGAWCFIETKVRNE